MTAPFRHGSNTRTALTGMRAEGISFTACGIELGMTRNAIAGLCYRLGLCTPKPVPEIVQFPSWGGCVWPVGDPGEPGFGFCGEMTSGVYCAAHHQRSVVPAAKREAFEAAI